MPAFTVERDERFPSIYRVRQPDGSLSDMMNLARARDIVAAATTAPGEYPGQRVGKIKVSAAAADEPGDRPAQRLQGVAGEIERDLLKVRVARKPTPTCFACGREYIAKAPIEDYSTRFCTDRCRAAFDNGLPPHDPTYANKSNPRWYSLPMGPKGFYIDCAGCGRRFDSKGLRCCSTECERAYRRKGEAKAVMQEVGMEPPAKRKCARAGCGGEIPNWKNGRRVSKSVQFCSPKCRRQSTTS